MENMEETMQTMTVSVSDDRKAEALYSLLCDLSYVKVTITTPDATRIHAPFEAFASEDAAMDFASRAAKRTINETW
jgi:hypothetical protein